MAVEHAIRLKALCTAFVVLVILLANCTREPELHLPEETATKFHITLVTDTSFRTPYTDYPAPTNYEFRHFMAPNDSTPEQTIESATVLASTFDRTAAVGIHRFLAWSNIDSNDGTQVVTIDEKGGQATASTTIDPDGISMRDTTAGESMGMPTIRHAPEMFYGGEKKNIEIQERAKAFDTSADIYDSISLNNVDVVLRPLVYSLRLELVLTGNDGHIVGTPGPTVLTSLARSVDIATGRTLHEPCGVFFTSKMPPHLASGAAVESNDTVTGELNTFGLCDMEPYKSTNENIFSSSRSDLRNYLFFTLTFNNGLSKTFRTDVTDIVKNNDPQGLIRVVIDAKSLKAPDKPSPGQSGGTTGFNPTVDDYDDVDHDFTM